MTEHNDPSNTRRASVLSAARRIFGERGYVDTNIRDVARYAHVSTATIYRYFENKEKIIEAVVEEVLKDVFDAIFEEALQYTDSLDLLIASITTLHRRIATNPLLRRLISTDRTQTTVQPIVSWGEQIERQIDQMGLQVIQSAIDTGAMDCDDPEALLVLVRCVLLGWIVSESQRAEPVSEERVTRMLTTLISKTRPLS